MSPNVSLQTTRRHRADSRSRHSALPPLILCAIGAFLLFVSSSSPSPSTSLFQRGLTRSIKDAVTEAETPPYIHPNEHTLIANMGKYPNYVATKTNVDGWVKVESSFDAARCSRCHYAIGCHRVTANHMRGLGLLPDTVEAPILLKQLDQLEKAFFNFNSFDIIAAQRPRVCNLEHLGFCSIPERYLYCAPLWHFCGPYHVPFPVLF